MIRKATPDDIEAVAQTYTELLTHERNSVSYSNWQLGLYPTAETAQKALEEESLFILEEKGEICASVILNQTQADFYNEIPWRFEAAPNEVLVIHTLCVPPSKSGHGYGVLTKTPELVREEIKGMMAEAVAAAKTAAPPVLPDHFHVEVTYVHHYDAYGCSHYPGASLISPTTVAFDADDYGDVLRFFYFVI